MSSWRVLNINIKEAPKLLVRTQFENSGYEIELTDLSRIWRKSVARDQIIRQASETGSSIDPGQDDEQFRIFLGKIESAFNSDDGTMLSLYAGDKDGSTLSIELSAELPHPLPALNWSLHLELLPQQDIESLLITPLLRHASALRYQMQHLISELHDKDRVISKICDRLETSGNDLTTVFPGVSNIKTSRKKAQREQLAKHVKGLADFDEGSWRAQSAGVNGNEEIDDRGLNGVLGGLPHSTVNSERFRFHEDWWQHLSSRPASQSKGSTIISAGSRSMVECGAMSEDESMQEEEFQTQNTPPHLTRTNPHNNPASQHVETISSTRSPTAGRAKSPTEKSDDSTTEDEDDLDAAPRQLQKTQASHPQVSRQKTVSPSPRRLSTFGGRSTTEQTHDAHDTAPEEKPPSAQPRSKLGKIGGKTAAAEVAKPEHEAESSHKTTRSTRVGVIGGKRAVKVASPPTKDSMENAVPTETAADVDGRASRSAAKIDSPAPREDSQERAYRTRHQLKHDLEEKAKAPMKKKRKF